MRVDTSSTAWVRASFHRLGTCTRLLPMAWQGPIRVNLGLAKCAHEIHVAVSYNATQPCISHLFSVNRSNDVNGGEK